MNVQIINHLIIKELVQLTIMHKTIMNLIKLTPKEAEDLSYKVGNLHQFKSDIMRTSLNISQFDIFKDIDSRNKDVYIALKYDPRSNYEFSGYTIY